MTTRGLVLTGGGARGAYQVGVLRGIAELLGGSLDSTPFRVLAGVSAGAINASFLATQASDFAAATEGLWQLWARLHMDGVFDTSPAALSRNGARLVAELGLGGLVRTRRVNHLLDTKPLRRLLEQEVRADVIAEKVRRGVLHGVAVTATNYDTGAAVTFFQGPAEAAGWCRSARMAVRGDITPEHVLASAALPVFFPPVTVAGHAYGDGCIRMTAPLSPAIHLGADRILAIGIRYPRPAETTLRLQEQAAPPGPTSLADIAGVLLNAVFLDALETDLERMERINRTVALIPEARRSEHTLRHVPVLAIRPSQDLGRLASTRFDAFPMPVRHLLRGLGASQETGWDLLSYLAFDSAYTEALLELGRRDAHAHEAALRRFFEVP